jgi:outer membrane biosynthesis protein TonB
MCRENKMTKVTNLTWDLGRLAKIAGVSLNEVWDRDDDDEDPDAKIASEDKRQKSFEKKNKGELKAADKAVPAKKVEKAEEKKPEPTAKAEEKKDDKPAEKKEEPKAAEEAKKRGRAANPESFNQHAKANAKSMTRGAFIKWAAETHGKGKNYASSLFAKYNPKSSRELKEAKTGWILVHPHMPTFTLAENYEMKQMQWVDSSSSFNTLVYTTEAEAERVAKYMLEWKGQTSVIEKITFED